MRLQEILDRVPGLDKRLVYYLEAQGFIQPTKIRKARISRRDYSPDDLRRIRQIWPYYQRGYSVQSAIEAAARAERSTAIVFLPVPMRLRRATLEMLREFDRVREAALVYGESADAILEVKAAEERDVYDVLDRVFEAAAVAGSPRIHRLADDGPSFRRVAASAGAARPAGWGMLAYVLIKVPVKQVGGVIESLRAVPGISEAAALYGETDVIARVEVSGQDELDDVVMNRIQAIPAVDSTRTFIAIGGMHWER